MKGGDGSWYLRNGGIQIWANYNDVSRRVVTLNGGLIRELPQNPVNSGLGIILICPDQINLNLTWFLHPSLLNGFLQGGPLPFK